MHFSLTIDTYNDAMQRAEDVADALEQLTYRLSGLTGPDAVVNEGAIRDANGNTVGQWRLAQHAPDVAGLIADAAAGDPGEGME